MTDKKDNAKPEEFDTTTELWDRIVDDIIENGAPCVETVEGLLADSCRHSDRPEDKP